MEEKEDGVAPDGAGGLGPTEESIGWRVGYSDGSGEEYIVDANDNAVATVRWGCGCCKSTRPLDADEIEHARLIASAPATAAAASAMLAALKKARVLVRPADLSVDEAEAIHRDINTSISAAEKSGIKSEDDIALLVDANAWYSETQKAEMRAKEVERVARFLFRERSALEYCGLLHWDRGTKADEVLRERCMKYAERLSRSTAAESAGIK